MAARESVALWLGATTLALIFLPKFAAGLTAVLAVSLGAAAIALFRGASPGKRTPRWSVVGIAAPALALTISAALASNPSIAFVGAVGQRAGAASWIAAATLGVALALTARPGDLGYLARAVGVFGAVVAASVLAEGAGLFSVARGGSPVAGLLENSLSVGQVLVIGCFCACAWAVSARKPAQRWIASACAVVAVAAAWRIGSTGTWVGLAVGALTVGVVHTLARTGKLRAARESFAVVIAAVVLVAAMVAVFGSATPGTLEVRLAEIASDRVPIWRSAVSASGTSPLVGLGPEHFTSFVTWESDPSAGIEFVGTYDPHDLLLYLLVCGGVFSLGVAIASAGILTRLMLKPLEDSASLARGCLIGGLAAWVATALFAWISPLALSIAAGTAAALAVPQGVPGEEKAARSQTLLRVAVAAVGVVVVAAVMLAGAVYEYRWGRLIDEAGAVDSALALDAVDASEDPTYAYFLGNAAVEDIRSGIVGVAGDAQFADVGRILERDSVWSVGLAMTRFDLEMARLARSPNSDWGAGAAAIEAGKKADRETGLWDYYGSVYAASFGYEAEAEEYARQAMEHPLPDNVRAYLIETYDLKD